MSSLQFVSSPKYSVACRGIWVYIPQYLIIYFVYSIQIIHVLVILLSHVIRLLGEVNENVQELTLNLEV